MITEKKTRISVLLPTLGSPRTLNAAVRSTLFALGSDDELLVLVSGDSSSPSLEKVKDLRLKVFFNPKPLKVFEALNILLEKAKGSLIGRMDSDDICLPWRFHLQVRVLRKQRLDFVFSNSILFGNAVKPFFVMPQIPIPLNNIQSGLYLALSNPFVHPTMLAKKSSLLSLGGYRSVLAEDLDLWLRGWQAGYKFGRTTGYGILYRRHSGQVTQSDDFLNRAQREPAFQTSRLNQMTLLASMGLVSNELPHSQALEKALRETTFLMSVSRSTAVKRLLEFGNRLLGRDPRS